MTWGISLDTTIEVLRVSKSEIESTIEENEKTMQFIQKQILMYASATPKDIMNVEPEENCIFQLHHEINQLFDDYNDCLRQNTLLYLMKEEIDKVIES